MLITKIFGTLLAISSTGGKLRMRNRQLNSLTNEDKQQPSTISAPLGATTFFENQLLTYKQAAQYLSLSEAYLRRLKRNGELPFVVVGGRAVRFRVCSLHQWIENREIK